MKTAITALQELLLKHNEVPEYECLNQNGPQHMASFEIVCRALGESATGVGHSKKEAKQDAARGVLYRLSRKGYSVPSPFHLPEPEQIPKEQGDLDSRCYVALLRELVDEYRMPPLEFELVGDTGPAHARFFTVRCCVGGSRAICTASTKKAARQASAEKMYKYLRKYCCYTQDFVEPSLSQCEDCAPSPPPSPKRRRISTEQHSSSLITSEAMVRAHDKKLDRFVETRTDLPQRPDLSRVISEDYRRMNYLYNESVRQEALAAMDRAASEGKSPVEQVEACLQLINLKLAWTTVKRKGHSIEESPLHIVDVIPLDIPITDAGLTRDEAATRLKESLQMMLQTFSPIIRAEKNKPNMLGDD